LTIKVTIWEGVLMMRINRRTDYAVRVMLALAKQPFGTRLSTEMIKESMVVPRAFLQRIVADLSREELIVTFPGPNGGLQLSRPAEDINLRHIWEAIEGPMLISECLQSPHDCSLSVQCPVRGRWGRLQYLMLEELESTDLKQLANEAHAIAASQQPLNVFPNS
jgi:Rrf2 family protein